MKYWMISPDMHKHIILGHSQAWFIVKAFIQISREWLTHTLVNKKKYKVKK